MTMQSIIGGLTIPHHVEAVIGAPNDLTGYLIDAAAEKVAFIFKIPKSGTITEIGFRTGAVTIADTLKIGLYTVDTSNNPTTTAYGGMVAGTQATPAANTWYNVALGTNCTATADDAAAVVIEFNSYVAGNLRIAALDGSSGSSGNICGFPESKQYTASWANIAARPVFSIKYSDGSYGFIYGCYPVSAVTETAFNSSSTPDERGLKFSIPFPARLSGFWLNYRVTGVTGSADVVLYDSDGTTVLQTHTIDFQKVNASLEQGHILSSCRKADDYHVELILRFHRQCGCYHGLFRGGAELSSDDPDRRLGLDRYHDKASVDGAGP